MSTAARTTVLNERGEALVAIMRHADGYPSEHGVELLDILSGFHPGGVGSGADSYNTMMELAAMLVRDLKAKHPDGNIYLTPPASEPWEEWQYTVYIGDAETARDMRLTVKVAHEGRVVSNDPVPNKVLT